MDYSDDLELEKRTIFDEFMLKGEAKGKLEIGSLILNTLANDSKCHYTIEELAERFGFTVDEILDWKAE